MNRGQINLLSDSLVARYPGPEQSNDGPDYQAFCTTHQWASLPLLQRPPDLTCPFCRAGLDEVNGRTRYVALKEAMLAQQIEQVPHDPISDGGPAFPVTDKRQIPGSPFAQAYVYHSGMSLRDHFAGQALMGMHARDMFDGGLTTPTQRATVAYIDADAMIAAREKSRS